MESKVTRLREFNPLLFLASLGAGGISVMPFAFLQYTHHTGPGLISITRLHSGDLAPSALSFFIGLEAVMAVFGILHFALTAVLVLRLVRWIGSEGYHRLLSSPLTSASVLAPFISLGMSMNVFIATVRFFIPPIAENLQSLMLPALIGWTVLWSALLVVEMKLLGASFAQSFDVSKINFGWLLHPFALGMITVIGTGIAAMSKDPTVAHIAAFMSMVSGTMGLFLLGVKLNAIFKSHFSAPGLPEKQFLPSLLIVVPNVTLYAIAAFRLTHYADHQFGAHAHGIGAVVVTAAFAFETWYMLFGLSMLRKYFSQHVFDHDFHVSQWGLICPFVAYAVLGSFFYKIFLPNPVILGIVLATGASAIVLFSILAVKQLRCLRARGMADGHDCPAQSISAQTERVAS
jgi:hypothetical protein